MSSSVLKVKSRIPTIPGTKPSIKNAQLLVSTGIPYLDNIIGGGLPIGSIFLIGEDTYGTYAKVMLKYFMAECIVCNHALLIASQDIEPSSILSDLPAPVATEPQTEPQYTDDQMKIAWRYQNMKIIDTSVSEGQVFGHYYDLTKTMEKEIMENAAITQWHLDTEIENADLFENMAYFDLLKVIQETLEKGHFFSSDTPEKRTVLRIAIHSLGSRLWLCDSEEYSHQDLLKFLYCLKSLLRNSYAVATITFPFQNFDHTDAVIERVEHLSDTAIRLESFAGSDKETNPLYKDYHGLFHIKKFPAINTLAPHRPESTDFVFKLRRKKFLIEVLHLPPEFEDTSQREQDEMASSSCMSSSHKNLLSF